MLSGNATASDDDALPERVAAALAQAELPAEALGAIAIPLTRWARPRPWQHRADAAMQPASTMKLLTAIVALDRLGPNHRGRTRLLAAGAIEGGRLEGDLVLEGGADPDLDLAALLHLLFQLRQRGVSEIAGGIVLDRTLFRPARIDIGVPPFDEAPEWPYNMIPDALMAAGNLMSLTVSALDGGAAQARLVPPLEGVELDASALTLTDKPCASWEDDWRLPRSHETAPGRWRIALEGGFPRGCEAHATLQLLDRDVIIERTVRALWRSLGGGWRKPPGQVREAAVPASAASAASAAMPIAQHESRPWGELLRPMNKRSDNLLARLLFLQLGLAAMAQDTATPTLELARREVERWFDERGIDRRGLVLDNGSGLSRTERISARTMASMIRAALEGRHAPELLMSLPVVGVDGTMQRRLAGTPAQGWARLKSGALSNVRAIAGTVRDAHGDTWVLVAMVNHEQARRAWPVLDALVQWVASSGARRR